MKAVVSGGSDYALTDADFAFLERTVSMHGVREIYTDGLPGVAEAVEAWARRQHLAVHRVTANFMHDGPATPAERNISLVAITRVVIAFPGKNTDDLIVKARKARRTIIESPSRQLALPPSPSTAIRTDEKQGPRP